MPAARGSSPTPDAQRGSSCSGPTPEWAGDLPDEASLAGRPLDDGGAVLGWVADRADTAVVDLHLGKRIGFDCDVSAS